MKKPPTLEDVVDQARQLSSVDKVRLIELVAPDVERTLPDERRERRRLLGLCRDLGDAPSFAEVDEARREAWSGFASTGH